MEIRMDVSFPILWILLFKAVSKAGYGCFNRILRYVETVLLNKKIQDEY